MVMYIRRYDLKFAKWGNSVAIRVPAEIVAELGISPNEEAQIRVTGEYSFEVTRDRRREEAMERIRKLRVPLPPGFKFDREEAHRRGGLADSGPAEP